MSITKLLNKPSVFCGQWHCRNVLLLLHTFFILLYTKDSAQSIHQPYIAYILIIIKVYTKDSAQPMYQPYTDMILGWVGFTLNTHTMAITPQQQSTRSRQDCKCWRQSFYQIKTLSHTTSENQNAPSHNYARKTHFCTVNAGWSFAHQVELNMNTVALLSQRY